MYPIFYIKHQTQFIEYRVIRGYLYFFKVKFLLIIVNRINLAANLQKQKKGVLGSLNGCHMPRTTQKNNLHQYFIFLRLWTFYLCCYSSLLLTFQMLFFYDNRSFEKKEKGSKWRLQKFKHCKYNTTLTAIFKEK